MESSNLSQFPNEIIFMLLDYAMINPESICSLMQTCSLTREYIKAIGDKLTASVTTRKQTRNRSHGMQNTRQCKWKSIELVATGNILHGNEEIRAISHHTYERINQNRYIGLKHGRSCFICSLSDDGYKSEESFWLYGKMHGPWSEVITANRRNDPLTRHVISYYQGELHGIEIKFNYARKLDEGQYEEARLWDLGEDITPDNFNNQVYDKTHGVDTNDDKNFWKLYYKLCDDYRNLLTRHVVKYNYNSRLFKTWEL